MTRSLTDPDGYAFLTEGAGIIGNGVRHRLAPTGPGRFREAADWARAHIQGDDVAFASFTFAGEGGSAIVVPDQMEHITLDRRQHTELGATRVRYAGSTIDEVAWMEAVQKATDRIAGGAYDKIVLARDLHVWSDHELDPISLTFRLAARFPSCLTFLHERFVGATPELLLRRRGRQITSVVLAGTAAPDQESGQRLLTSRKDGAEHGFARESAVRSLRPFVTALTVDDEPWLLRLDNVQHLATRITGALTDDHHVLALLDALHPTAAVGASPASAVSDIEPLEQMQRERYAGPVGVVHANGDGTFGIALRCAQLRGNRARLFAGSGLVADSLPDEELQETRLKLRAMQSVLSG